ncbi:MAG: Type I Iterative PKS [Chrysothrix sp. TS-e1954]|nr:MAG: Type I Iterative PKS [Chrysothrix sp. TS-e1954]
MTEDSRSSSSHLTSPSCSSSTAPSSVSLSDLATTQSDDVAIIGMACRTAGGNDSPEKLWKFLWDKKDASGDSPSWRWEPWIRRDPRNAKIIESTISKGYFIEDIENFDAAFFGISPKEAEQMDPHQRLGLEVTWEALENAGINPKSLSGSDTAVYMGVDSDDYSRLLLEDLPNIEAWMGIGTTAHGIPNRISYHLDLMGPSAAVDAACASSLVAVNSGRQAILAGESEVAIVGGVNVCLSPALFYMLGSAGALSPDGVCLSFDDDAHGYARGEGAAVLILKRMSKATADGDHVLATIKGSAVAQDGKTNGIMAPNAKAQELVARKALRQANIDPLTVGYIEAHATSTSLGDPTEISAISAVYGVGRPQHAPAAVGSIKPNVGHLEAAAGAISLVKGVMAVDKGLLPPQARLKKLNTRVDWENSGLSVVREQTKWSETVGPRRAAICSYGYGGTVSHAVIEQSPAPVVVEQDDQGGPTLLVLSAPQEKRLIVQSAAQAAWIAEDGKHENLRMIAATLAQHRFLHDYRAAFVVSSHAEAADMLRSFTQGDTIEWAAQGRTLGTDISKDVVWIFSGHGAQWTEMGKELVQNSVFHETLAPLDAIVVQELGYSALDRLKTGDFHKADEIQVLTYLTQVGLSQLLRSKGIQPHAVIGHSVGEIAASVTAGCLTPKEGAIIVTRRARQYAQMMGLGSMFMVTLPFAQVAGELAEREDIVAAINSSPSSCVVSGAVAPLKQYIESLKDRGVRTFQVKTDIAFHSPMLRKMAEQLPQDLYASLNPQPPTMKLYSTSQADPRSQSPRDASYWVNNTVNPVWLTSTVNAAADDGYRTFLEVSSHPIVLHSVHETLLEKGLEDFATVSTMEKNKPAEKRLLCAIAQLFVKGASVDFAAFLGRQWCSQVPSFRWSHKPFWKAISSGPTNIEKVHDVDTHTVLGQRTVIAGTKTTLYTTELVDSNKPFPRPHQVYGTNIIPAAVYVNTFHHATGGTMLSSMALKVPLAITEDSRNVQVIVQGDKVKVVSRLSSSDDSSWVTHSTAFWSAKQAIQDASDFSVSAIQKRIGRTLPNTFAVDYLAKVGVTGIAFPWAVTEHFANPDEMMVKVDNDPDSKEITWHNQSWAPTLDAASSVGSSMFADDPKMRIVSQIDRVHLVSDKPPPKMYYLYVTETDAAADDKQSRSADVSVLDVDGKLLAKLESIRLTEMESDAAASGTIDSLVHHMAWVPARLSEKPLSLKEVVVVSHDRKTLEQYGVELQRHVPRITVLESAQELQQKNSASVLDGKSSAIVYCPGPVLPSGADIASSAEEFIWEAATIIRTIVERRLPVKFFIITSAIFAAESDTALAQAPLYGLARVIASEHSDIWGGLIDAEGPNLPITPLKYVQGQDIIRFEDGVCRVARFRPFSKSQRLLPSSTRTLLPKPEGTYVVTGGLGALGLETCDFLIEKGARRIVIISRRALPPRSQWSFATDKLSDIVTRLNAMEKLGATVHVLSLDIGAQDASEHLVDALKLLSLPPVLGVVHASGVLEDSLLVDTTKESFGRVLAPKVSGAIALHKAFPVASLDFFVLYSSIGQLVGTSGQSSYGAGNSFLDTLASYRRRQGDNAIAFQWSAWRGLGMGASTDFLTLELQSKGITDVRRDEGFQAWEHMSSYDVDHAVVTRSLTFDADDPVPCGLLEDVVVRRPRAQASAPSSEGNSSDSSTRPTDASELKVWLDLKIRECIASVMKIEDIDEIDARVALTDVGVDSVMTIALRTKLQSVLRVKVPQTLTWNYPNVTAMVDWFLKEFQNGATA